MKTTIIDELELPQTSSEALSREALRQGKPVNQLVREWLLAKADQIISAASNPPAPRHKAA